MMDNEIIEQIERPSEDIAKIAETLKEFHNDNYDKAWAKLLQKLGEEQMYLKLLSITTD